MIRFIGAQALIVGLLCTWWSSAIAAEPIDVRVRIAGMQQLLDRMLASDNPPPAVGTAGTTADTPGAGGMVMVSRSQLVQLRQQLDALLSALNRR